MTANESVTSTDGIELALVSNSNDMRHLTSIVEETEVITNGLVASETDGSQVNLVSDIEEKTEPPPSPQLDMQVPPHIIARFKYLYSSGGPTGAVMDDSLSDSEQDQDVELTTMTVLSNLDNDTLTSSGESDGEGTNL